MITVTFHQLGEIPDDQLKIAIIAARYDAKWIFCRHKQRATWELPGGHREPGEDMIDTARRELYEEMGAVKYEIKPVCVYGVDRGGAVGYGMLFFADVKMLGALPSEMEIGEIKLFETLPDELTYPAIQPHLLGKVRER